MQVLGSPEMKAYVFCNLKAARFIAHQPGDRVSLAIAARGMCGKEDGVIAIAIQRTYSTPEVALKILASTRNGQVEVNAAEIVRERERAQVGTPRRP